jgi:hypothetical protein
VNFRPELSAIVEKHLLFVVYSHENAVSPRGCQLLTAQFGCGVPLIDAFFLKENSIRPPC